MMPAPAVILFDWGDTVMYDDPAVTTPMVEWETVRAVDGIAETLGRLHAGGRTCILATSASISDEAQIRGALSRAGLDGYFARIYCFQNTGLPKGVSFYRHILTELGIAPESAVMVGDTFEKDVLAANAAGMFAVWFNPRSDEVRSGERHATIHSLGELPNLLGAA
jgi:putative hydrolase of the HAD superfamily